jgi:hypothetical protein
MQKNASLVSLWFACFSLIFAIFLMVVNALRAPASLIWICAFLSVLFSTGFTVAAYYGTKSEDKDTNYYFEDDFGIISETDGLPKGIYIYYQHSKKTYKIELVQHQYTRIDFGNGLVTIDHLNDNHITITPSDYRIGFKIENGKSILVVGNYEE